MKMIYCTCNVSVSEAFVKMLEENEVKDYQIIDLVKAKSVKGEPRLNNPVWPGHNTSIWMQFSNDKKAGEIMKLIREFNSRAFNENELVTACMWSLDDYLYD